MVVGEGSVESIGIKSAFARWSPQSVQWPLSMHCNGMIPWLDVPREISSRLR